MTRFLLSFKSFLPRSRVALSLSVVILIAGAVLAPIVELLAADPDWWLGQHMATSALLILGISLGNTLSAIRGWSPSLLMPSMLPVHIGSAIVLILGVWSGYAIVMIQLDQLAGIAVTGSLAAAMLAMMFGAGLHTRFVLPLAVVWILFVITGDLRNALLEALRHPAANGVLVALALGALFELLRGFRSVPGTKPSVDLGWLSVRGAGNDRIVKHRYRCLLPLKSVSPGKAFIAAIEHSVAQAWINDAVSFLGSNALVLLMILPIWQEVTNDYTMVIALLTALFAVMSPLIDRTSLVANLRFIWLTGIHPARFDLGFFAFLGLMRRPLRLCMMGLIVIAILNDLSRDSATYLLALNLLITTIGTASVALLTALLIHRHLDDGAFGNIIVFTFLLLAELLMGGWLVISLSLHFDYISAIALSLIYSGLLLLICAWIYGYWMQSQSELD